MALPVQGTQRCSSTAAIDAMSRVVRGATSLKTIEQEDEWVGSDYEKVLRTFKNCVRDLLKSTPRINRVELERAVILAFPDIRKDLGHLWSKQVHTAMLRFRHRCKSATSGKKLGELTELLPLLRASTTVA